MKARVGENFETCRFGLLGDLSSKLATRQRHGGKEGLLTLALYRITEHTTCGMAPDETLTQSVFSDPSKS